MKSVSTGVGLCVLGVCVLGAAALSTSQVGGQAFAQSSSRPMTAELQEAAVRADTTTIGLAGCIEAPLNWLTQTPKLISFCPDLGGIGFIPVRHADLDGDGRAETFNSSYNTLAYLVASGQVMNENPIRLYRVHTEVNGDGSRSVKGSLVFDSSQIGTWFKQLYPSCVSVSLFVHGWADVDEDGDLDLVMGFDTQPTPTSQVVFGQVWFENTGYQAPPPPNPYDLDQDGEVGAGDISVLLLNYD